MEEILFKAKSMLGYSVFCDNDGHGWIYGFPVHRTSYYGKKADVWFMTRSDNALAEFQETAEVNPETICRYIGVQDKNGRKIFENDIVKTKYGRLCVVTSFRSPCFIGVDLKPLDTDENLRNDASSNYDLLASENLEVVGNICDEIDRLYDALQGGAHD